MKRLILIRHGKSSWEHDVPDSQRPLKKRAFRDADKVIQAFEPNFKTRAVLWSSFAVRALETAKIFKERLGVSDFDFFVKKDLYTFDDAELMKTIAACDDAVDQLIVFGHNPAITDLVNYLGSEVFDNIPTTGLTAIDFAADSWSSLQDGKTAFYFFPKNL